MDGGWKKDILLKLRRRHLNEVLPFKSLYQLQEKLIDQNTTLRVANTNLSTSNDLLRGEKVELEAALSTRTTKSPACDSLTFQELQLKMFNLQEELTEMHRRKGENAQQVIDLTAALKITEKEISDKEIKIQSLDAEILILKEDLRLSEVKARELESTNQLLKDEYQALQLALNTAESSLNSIKKENENLILQLMSLKAKDADRMNMENDLFMMKKHQLMQLELAEAASEFKHIPDRDDPNTDHLHSLGVSIPTKSVLKFDAHEGEVMCVQWDFSGRYFATAGTDRKIKVWDISSHCQADCKASLVGSNAAVMAVDFDQNGTMVLGASNDFATRVWTIDDCRLRHTLTGHSGKVLSAKFCSDASRVVSGSHDRTLKLWDLRSKACISTKFAGSSCNDVATTDSAVISGHFDKKVRFWDLRSSAEPSQEVLVGGRVTSLDLSRDKSLLAVCARDDTVTVYDVRTNNQLQKLAADDFHVGCDWSRISLSPDKRFVSAGAGEGSIYVWNVETGFLETVLRSHGGGGVNAVSWHPAGTNILSVDKTKTCVVWSDM